MRYCRLCHGKGVTRRLTEHGAHVTERCFECAGSGQKEVVVWLSPDERQRIVEAREILARYLATSPVIGSWRDLETYLALSPIERFHVLYLDTKNRLIEDACFGTGTINHVPVYPREIVKKALMLDAASMILTHNHPSGDPTPSRADIAMTGEIVKAAEALGINVHDHVVVGANRNYSMRSNPDGLDISIW